MKVVMCVNTSYGCGVHHLGSHHYADLFAENGQDVFWVGSPIHPGNILRARKGDAEEIAVTATWRSGGEQVKPRITAYHPLTYLPYRKAPLLGSRAVMARTVRHTAPNLRTVLKKHGFASPDLLWLAQSHASYSMLKTVKAKKIAYRVSDSFHDFDSVPDSMREGEREIILAADVVFVTAHRLLEEVRQIRTDNVLYLPNGVDFDHFHNSAGEPDDLKSIPGPRILYVGTISTWFDVALLTQTARSLPDYSFVIIGRVEIDLSALANLPNVHLLGARPYTTLPPYLHSADAAIIPFLKNRITDATSPIKLFEYFAAGLPVVSTRLYETEKTNSPARLADSPEEFAAALRAAVAEGRDRPEFTDFAAANSWATRFQLIQENCL